MINVTKPYLPDKSKFKKYLDRIYDTGWLTNDGPLVNELECQLKEYLGVRNIVLVSNGTLALQVAYRLLGIEGDVVTTPFSFVATSSSLTWDKLTPVYADIDSRNFNLDPENIVASITEKTTAILPVHVFGNTCDVEAIDAVAKANNLKVVYDAAHAFAVKHKGSSVLNHGDISTLSFHATKLFHTIEGGALVFNDDELYTKAKRMINFGFDTGVIHQLGINAKMNEFQAAMGLAHLEDIDQILIRRRELSEYYKEKLGGFVEFQELSGHITYNYSYFPVLFESEDQALKVLMSLNNKQIFPRRYFHPSLDTIDFISEGQVMEKSRDIASRILCLPLFPDLSKQDQNEIVDTVIKSM